MVSKIEIDGVLAACGLVSMSDAELEAETIDKLQDMTEKFSHGDFGDIDDDKNLQQSAARYRKFLLCTGPEKDHGQTQKPKRHRVDEEVMVQQQQHSAQGSMNGQKLPLYTGSREYHRRRNPARHRPGKEVMIQPQEQVRQVPMNGHTYEAPEFGYSIDGTKLPELPPIESLNDKIGECGKPFEKQLTQSDVQDNQNRLSFHKEDVKLAFQPLLRLGEEDPANGIKVTVYDPMGNAYEMRYKTWANGKAHVLIGGWKKFYDEHDLKANEDWVSVWMFRHKYTGKICIALTWKRIPTRELLARRKPRGD